MTEFQLGDWFAFDTPRDGSSDRKTASVTVHEELWAALDKDPALRARFDGVIAKLREGGELEGGPIRRCFYCWVIARRTMTIPARPTQEDEDSYRKPVLKGKDTCGDPACEAEFAIDEKERLRQEALTPAERESERRAAMKKLKDVLKGRTKL